jgi:hypothetical protein
MCAIWVGVAAFHTSYQRRRRARDLFLEMAPPHDNARAVRASIIFNNVTPWYIQLQDYVCCHIYRSGEAFWWPLGDNVIIRTALYSYLIFTLSLRGARCLLRKLLSPGMQRHVDIYWRFEGRKFLYLNDGGSTFLRKVSKHQITRHHNLKVIRRTQVPLPWWWRQYVPPKSRRTSIRLFGITT